MIRPHQPFPADLDLPALAEFEAVAQLQINRLGAVDVVGFAVGFRANSASGTKRAAQAGLARTSIGTSEAPGSISMYGLRSSAGA